MKEADEPVVPVPERDVRRPTRVIGAQEEAEGEKCVREHSVSAGAQERARRHAAGLSNAGRLFLSVLLGAALGRCAVLAACAEAAAVAPGARSWGARHGSGQRWRA